MKKAKSPQQDIIEQEVARLRAAKRENQTLPAMMTQRHYGETCQSCGGLAATRYVEFYQNVGVLVLRYHKSIKGHFCKSCISKYFWEFTLVDVLFGWWGVISFIVTPFFILNNIGRYVGSLGMEDNPNTVTQHSPSERLANFIVLSLVGTTVWTIILFLDYLLRADSYYLNPRMNPVTGLLTSTGMCLGGWFVIAAVIAFAIRK